MAAEVQKRGIRRIELDARKATSYAIISALAPRMGFRVVEEKAWNWENEEMVEMTLLRT